jgi:hypothetical protein
MNALFGCEFSQIVTLTFRNKGHNAYSCDLLPCEGGHPELHYQKDIFEVIKMKHWNFIGLHPPCTKIALSGNRSYAEGKPRHQERIDAIEWTINLWQLACDNAEMVYMENPLGAINGDKRLPKPQIIHPYYFGDNVPKKTCLWLKGLNPLVWSDQNTLFDNKSSVEPEYLIYKSAKNKSGTSKYSVFGKLGKGHGHERSVFFPGIARAMAEQWGVLEFESKSIAG